MDWGLGLSDDFAAGDGAKDFGGGKEVDFSLARFEMDGAINDRTLLKLNDLLAFEGVVLADCEGMELGGRKDGLLGA